MSNTAATGQALPKPDDGGNGYNTSVPTTASTCSSWVGKTTTAHSDCKFKPPNWNKLQVFQNFTFSASAHLLSISVTLGLLGIYIRSPGWKPGPTQINLLLIASKAHEWLIVGSLSIMLLHRIRVCLKSSQGVPLGFLASPFQLSSAYYIFNIQFWEAATKSASNTRGDITTKCVVLLTMFIAFAAGPSTGIVMLPKLDWWAVTDHELEATNRPRSMVNPILVNATLEEFYPQTIISDRFPSSCQLPSASQINSTHVNSSINTVPICASEGAPQIFQSLSQALTSGRESDNQLKFNFSMSTTDHIRDISIGWEAGDNSTGEGTVYATTLADLVVQELQFHGDGMWQHLGIPVKVTSQATRYSIQEQLVTQSTNFALDATTSTEEVLSTSNVQWRQPAVAIHCMGLETGNGRDYVVNPWEDGPFPFGPLPNNLTFSLPENALGSSTSIQFLDMQDHININVSTALLTHSNTSKSTTLCLVAARWIPTDIGISRPSEISAQSSLSASPSLVEAMESRDMSNFINISADWANNLNTLAETIYRGGPIPAANDPTIGTFEHTQKMCDVEDSRTTCLAVAFSLYLTDALSRLQHAWPVHNCDGDMEKSPHAPLKCRILASPDIIDILPGDLPKCCTGISVSYYNHKYVYGIVGLTDCLAWVVLTCHFVLVMVHFTEHFLRKRTYKDKGWMDVGELVTLALKAESPEALKDSEENRRNEQEGGPSTWRLRVFIEEDGGGKPTIIVRRRAWSDSRDRSTGALGHLS